MAKEFLVDQQRQRVIARASAVFAERGYRNTTVDDLVAAAHIGVGSFYSLFSGKEEVLLFAYDGIVSEAREAVTVAAERGESWTESVLLGLRELLRLVATEPASARVALIEIQTGGPTAFGRYEETLEELIRVLRAGRELAEAGGKDLPQTFEETAVGGIAWLLHCQVGLGKHDSVPDSFPELAELVLGPYIPQPELRGLIRA